MTKGTKFKLPPASKAGMQKKQGRNFLLPKEKPKRGGIGGIPMPRQPKPMPKPKPMPRPPVLRPGDKPLRPTFPVLRPGDKPQRPKFIKMPKSKPTGIMTPAKRLQIKKLKEKLKKLMGDAKPTGRPSFRERRMTLGGSKSKKK